MLPPDTTLERQPNSTVYTPPEPILRLEAHQASYHVEIAGGPGLPVYERTGVRSPGDEVHTQAPFATHKAGFLASYEGSGLNHRVGMPHAYGRYELSGAQCAFVHTTVLAQPGDSLLIVRKTWLPGRQLILQFTVP